MVIFGSLGKKVKNIHNRLEKKQVESKLIEICNHCGRNVTFGSGLFVNRIPDFNDHETRIANGLLYYLGDFVCIQCDTQNEEI